MPVKHLLQDSVDPLSTFLGQIGALSDNANFIFYNDKSLPELQKAVILSKLLLSISKRHMHILNVCARNVYEV